MSSKFQETIVFNSEELEVSGEVYEASRGARERGTGLQLEPDEDASLEFGPSCSRAWMLSTSWWIPWKP